MATAGRKSFEYLAMSESHVLKVAEAQVQGMWPSSIDLATGRALPPSSRPEGLEKRVYRSIHAPGGSTLYWDMPLVAAAQELARVSGDVDLSKAADAYCRAFIERCTAPTGIFLWGNHYFWDLSSTLVMRFEADEPPAPCDMSTETGSLHETRPLPPAWGALWNVSPEAVEREIRASAEAHIFDPWEGGFNRHADGAKGHAFLESGGILCESLAFLSCKTGDRKLTERALTVANWSRDRRDRATGLVPVNPTGGRWDALVSTTECGLWAGSLLRAADYLGSEDLARTARDAVAAYLKYGFDSAAGKFFGRLLIKDGAPVLAPGETPHEPGAHADFWEPMFPRHDYPAALGEACCSIFTKMGGEAFEEGVRRMVAALRASLPPREGKGAFAEHYGRAIHFLLKAADALGEEEFRKTAEDLADDAVSRLFAYGMFRGRPHADICEAVDGVGVLILSLVYLATGRDPDGMGFGF